MDNLLLGWTAERVTQLAPDETIAESGRRLANPDNAAWLTIGYGEYSVWGIYQGSANNPYTVKIDLLKLQHGDYHWQCSCTTHKSPCEHILALLFLVVDNLDSLSEAAVPDYVSNWWDKAARRALEKEERQRLDSLANPQRDTEREQQYQARKRRIGDGLEELEHWLINLIRRGLADPQVQSYEFWDTRAARMVDAQASGVAVWLRDMGGIPVSGTEWIEPLLYQLGRLYLLIESYKRFDDLTLEIQADIRSVLGWHMKRNEVSNAGGITDRWLVIGRYTESLSDRMKTRRVWLRGLESGHDALLQEFTFGDALFETHLQPGWSLEARIVFYPSRYPLRAFIGEKLSEVNRGIKVKGASIHDSIIAYSRALSQNPWLPQFPFLLDKTVTTRFGGGWVVREADGTYLPLSDRFKEKFWSLMALCGGSPIQVAGEWDGTSFYPTGAVADGRFVDFEEIGKI
jgi:hypothetical protein